MVKLTQLLPTTLSFYDLDYNQGVFIFNVNVCFFYSERENALQICVERGNRPICRSRNAMIIVSKHSNHSGAN